MTKREIVNYLTENYGKGVENENNTCWVINNVTRVILPHEGKSIRVCSERFHFYSNYSYGFGLLIETICGVYAKNDRKVIF